MSCAVYTESRKKKPNKIQLRPMGVEWNPLTPSEVGWGRLGEEWTNVSYCTKGNETNEVGSEPLKDLNICWTRLLVDVTEGWFVACSLYTFSDTLHSRTRIDRSAHVSKEVRKQKRRAEQKSGKRNKKTILRPCRMVEWKERVLVKCNHWTGSITGIEVALKKRKRKKKWKTDFGQPSG